MTVGSGISFSGLASGLNTTAIIAQLVSIERIPINALEAEQQEARSKISLIDDFGGLVRELQDKAEVLSKSSSFFAFTTSTSHDNITNVSVTGSPVAGSHSVTVNSTAAVDRWALDGVADSTTDLASADGQTLSFDVNGNSYSVSVTAADSSLTEVLDAVEAAVGTDVNASIVNSGTVESPSYQLVLASGSSGVAYKITNLTTDIAGLNATATNITVGSDAEAVIDGLTVIRSNNDFSGVIEGLGLDLIASSATEMTITVDADRDLVRSQIDEFISSFNAVVKFTNDQNKYTEAEGAGGLLIGDGLLRSVRRDLSSALDVPIATVLADTEGYSTLSLVGIRQLSNGSLEIDETIFDAKMEENIEALSGLFVDSDGFDNGGADPDDPAFLVDTTTDDGLADNLVRSIERMFGTFNGSIIDQDTGERQVLESLFKGRKTALESNIKRFGEQIEAKERRLDIFEATLVRRYAALEEAIGALNAQGAALANALQ
ncbi:MAG: flagellar hook-associated protein 2 [Chlamydiales bacterium]|jgi:flagellar hook-associated protein 2